MMLPSVARRKYLTVAGADDDVRRMSLMSDIVLRPGQTTQRAVNSLPPSGGKIYLMDGNFRVADTLVISKNNVEIIGQSQRGTAILRGVSSANPVVSLTGSGITLKNIRLEESSTDSAGTLITVRVSGDGCRVSDCVFTDGDYAIYVTSCNQVYIDGNRVEGARRSAQDAITLDSVTYSVVIGNNLHGVGGSGGVLINDCSYVTAVANVSGSGASVRTDGTSTGNQLSANV